MSAIFVTATDTSVGKTFICGLLLRYLLDQGVRAGYQKWASTGGDDPPADLVHVLARAGVDYDPGLLDQQVPYRFRLPASPHLAAAMEKRRIEPEVIVDQYTRLADRYEVLIVEGVGGLLVPLRRDLLLADLVARLGLPALVVARSGLGTINHTLLTLEGLRNRAIPVLGVIFSDAADDENQVLVEDNMRTIAEIGQVRVLGRLPRCRTNAEAIDVFREIGAATQRIIRNNTR